MNPLGMKRLSQKAKMGGRRDMEEVLAEQKKERMRRLHMRMKSKFSAHTEKDLTRESKIKLNQDDDRRKVALLGEKQAVFPIADNRKKMQMEKVQNAINGKEVREALKFAINSGFQVDKDVQKILQEEQRNR